MSLLITIGSTRFDVFLNEICTFLYFDLFFKNGFKEITIQYGNSVINEFYYKKLKIKYIKFIKLINYAEFDFVIGHGGSGTIIEVLSLEIPMICFCNYSLMDNHQFELLDKLNQLNFITFIKEIKELLNIKFINKKVEFNKINYNNELKKDVLKLMRN